MSCNLLTLTRLHSRDVFTGQFHLGGNGARPAHATCMPMVWIKIVVDVPRLVEASKRGDGGAAPEDCSLLDSLRPFPVQDRSVADADGIGLSPARWTGVWDNRRSPLMLRIVLSLSRLVRLGLLQMDDALA